MTPNEADAYMSAHFLKQAKEYTELAERHLSLSKHVLPPEERERYAKLAKGETELAEQIRKLAKDFGDLAMRA